MDYRKTYEEYLAKIIPHVRADLEQMANRENSKAEFLERHVSDIVTGFQELADMAVSGQDPVLKAMMGGDGSSRVEREGENYVRLISNSNDCMVQANLRHGDEGAVNTYMHVRSPPPFQRRGSETFLGNVMGRHAIAKFLANQVFNEFTPEQRKSLKVTQGCQPGTVTGELEKVMERYAKMDGVRSTFLNDHLEPVLREVARVLSEEIKISEPFQFLETRLRQEENPSIMSFYHTALLINDRILEAQTSFYWEDDWFILHFDVEGMKSSARCVLGKNYELTVQAAIVAFAQLAATERVEAELAEEKESRENPNLPTP